MAERQITGSVLFAPRADPPVGWTQGSPPPPAPPEKLKYALYKPAAAASRAIAPRSPGLLVESTDDNKPSLLTPYFENAVLIKRDWIKQLKSREQAYTPPSPRKQKVEVCEAFELDEMHVKTLRTIFTVLDKGAWSFFVWRGRRVCLFFCRVCTYIIHHKH